MYSNENNSKKSSESLEKSQQNHIEMMNCKEIFLQDFKDFDNIENYKHLEIFDDYLKLENEVLNALS